MDRLEAILRYSYSTKSASRKEKRPTPSVCEQSDNREMNPVYGLSFALIVAVWTYCPSPSFAVITDSGSLSMRSVSIPPSLFRVVRRSPLQCQKSSLLVSVLQVTDGATPFVFWERNLRLWRGNNVQENRQPLLLRDTVLRWHVRVVRRSPGLRLQYRLPLPRMLHNSQLRQARNTTPRLLLGLKIRVSSPSFFF